MKFINKRSYYLADDYIESFMDLLKVLSGKKTYLVALAIAVVAFCQHLGYVPNETALFIYGLLGATGLATTRAAISKVE